MDTNAGMWARDTVERVFWTVVQVVAGAFLTAVTANLTSAEALDKETVVVALTTGYAAALAALKAWVARSKPGTISPASFAKAKD